MSTHLSFSQQVYYRKTHIYIILHVPIYVSERIHIKLLKNSFTAPLSLSSFVLHTLYFIDIYISHKIVLPHSPKKIALSFKDSKPWMRNYKMWFLYMARILNLSKIQLTNKLSLYYNFSFWSFLGASPVKVIPLLFHLKSLLKIMSMHIHRHLYPYFNIAFWLNLVH